MESPFSELPIELLHKILSDAIETGPYPSTAIMLSFVSSTFYHLVKRIAERIDNHLIDHNYLNAKGLTKCAATYSAAKAGHLEVLKWLKKNGCESDFFTCAEVGHMEVLRWLRKEEGCTLSECACAKAAREAIWKC